MTAAFHVAAFQRLVAVCGLSLTVPFCMGCHASGHGSQTADEHPATVAPATPVANAPPADPSVVKQVAAEAPHEAVADLPPETPAEVQVQLVDLAGFAQILERHRGSYVLVDFWATWCAPCKELFPHTVALHRKHARRGLKVISVSLDEPESGESPAELQARVLKFLKSQKATFVNVIAQPENGGDIFEQLDIDGGFIPHLRLYAPSGELQTKFFFDPDSGQGFTHGDIADAVAQALASQ